MPTHHTPSQIPTALPLLAFTHPPPPKVPIFNPNPSPIILFESSSSSSTSPPPSTTFTLKRDPPTFVEDPIYMEHDEYLYQMAANFEAIQKSMSEMEVSNKFVEADYPFPELKDPTYKERIIIKPKVYNPQPISVRSPSPQPLLLPPTQPFPPPAPPPPSRPPTTITYRLKKTVAKSSSPSSLPPS